MYGQYACVLRFMYYQEEMILCGRRFFYIFFMRVLEMKSTVAIYSVRY